MFFGLFGKPTPPKYPSNVGLFPVSDEELTAEEYNSVIENERNNVVSSEYIPPKIGTVGDFGKFRVRYRMPTMPIAARIK